MLERTYIFRMLAMVLLNDIVISLELRVSGTKLLNKRITDIGRINKPERICFIMIRYYICNTRADIRFDSLEIERKQIAEAVVKIIQCFHLFPCSILTELVNAILPVFGNFKTIPIKAHTKIANT